MKNRLVELFENKNNQVLNVYFTAGYPKLDDTINIAVALEKAGVDCIEIGIPYSDPVADGPIIQEANKVALDNGMSLKLLFQQLKDLRRKVRIPVLLMGYFNTVLQYGVERFCKDCKEVGIDGCILPDLPLNVFNGEYSKVFKANDLSVIWMIAPQTSEARIRIFDAQSDGFLYLLSSSTTTGNIDASSNSLHPYLNKIKGMNLKSPTLVGFGIHDKQTFENACSVANGAIIGSAFVKLLHPEFKGELVYEFVSTVR